LTIQHTFVSVEEKNSVDHGALKTINQLYRDINGGGDRDEDKHCQKQIESMPFLQGKTRKEPMWLRK
jgi:hypothetical protein